MIIYNVINKIDFLDIFTLTISIIALIATLRKKEFGKLYFITKIQANDHILIQVIKSDLYDLKIVCEPYKNMSFTILIQKENETEFKLFSFPNETKPIIEIGLLQTNTILKFKSCNSSKVQIQYKDKYNNHYKQEMSQNDISERKHINIWNLTFVGS